MGMYFLNESERNNRLGLFIFLDCMSVMLRSDKNAKFPARSTIVKGIEIMRKLLPINTKWADLLSRRVKGLHDTL